jgi:hypothetical protein
MIAFLAGIIVGAIGLLLIAYLMVRPEKPEAKPTVQFHAVGHDISGDSKALDAHHDYLLRQVLKQASDAKLWEVEFPTRH